MTTNGKTVVLVADDEPSTLALVSGHLRARGFKVLEATDGDQAWELAHEHLPHLVMLDVMMPGMSGWEVCRKIREAVSLAHTGVIMLTGIGENLNEMTSPLYGADAYIDKPFEFSELDRRIEETLERRLSGALGRGDNYIPTEEDDRANQDEPVVTPQTQRPSSFAPDFEEAVTSVFKPKRPDSPDEPTRIRPKSTAVTAKAQKAQANGAPKIPVKGARAVPSRGAPRKAAQLAKPSKAGPKPKPSVKARPAAKPAAKKSKPARASTKGKAPRPASQRAAAAARKAGTRKHAGPPAKPKRSATRAAKARSAAPTRKKAATRKTSAKKAPSKTRSRAVAPKARATQPKAKARATQPKAKARPKKAQKKARATRQGRRAGSALTTTRRKGRRAAKA